jgi:hypothetical protein
LARALLKRSTENEIDPVERNTVMKAMHLIPIVSLLAPTAALAQPQVDSLDDTSGVDHHVAAPANDVEVAVATGYAQSAGPIGGSQQHLEDLTGPGGAVQLEVGYRIIPELSVGAYGSYQQAKHGDQLDSQIDVLGATAGVQAIGHLRPSRSIDPWISLGAGWKGLWLNAVQGKNTSLQGLELARLQIGVDYRVSPEVSIAPVIGGSLGMFLSEDSPMTTDYTEITDKKVGFTGFAGISGRFDLGGKR